MRVVKFLLTIWKPHGSRRCSLVCNALPRPCRSPDDDKKSLAEVQAVVDKTLGDLKALDGVKSVQRVVCGGCLDYKLITALDGEKYGDWEAAGHPPEAEFLKAVEAIDGITTVETQTFTIMPM